MCERVYTEFEIAARTDVGRVRSNNQDCVHIDAARGLFVLADGVGGGPGGEVASCLAVATVTRLLESELDRPWYRVWGRADQARLRVLQRVVMAAHRAVRRRIGREPELAGMACTLLIGVLGVGRCLCAAVGDSRIYRSTPSGLQQITRDQTLAEKMLADGFVEADDPRLRRYQHVLTQAVGGARDPEVQSCVVPLDESDRLLACSDGLNGMLDDARIKQIIGQPLTLEGAVDALVEQANRAGGQDNISVVVATTRGRGLLPLTG